MGQRQLYGKDESYHMKTGTDRSLAECRSSGYPVVEHGKRPMDPKKRYRLTISNTDAWGDSGKVLIRRPLRDGFPAPVYDTDDDFSYEELWQHFEKQGAGIKDYCDFKNCPLPNPEQRPCFLDFAELAGTLRYYGGLP